MDSSKMHNDNDLTKNTESDIEYFINLLHLKPHIEGGLYTQTHKSSSMVKSTKPSQFDGEERSAGTAIYYLLKGEDFSSWHRLKSDEIWHFYTGSPLHIHVIDTNGQLTTYVLGDPRHTRDASFQLCINAGDYFAAENVNKDSYSLVGCSVSPGFEYKDFELADTARLCQSYPQHEKMIKRLTRSQQDRSK